MVNIKVKTCSDYILFEKVVTEAKSMVKKKTVNGNSLAACGRCDALAACSENIFCKTTSLGKAILEIRKYHKIMGRVLQYVLITCFVCFSSPMLLVVKSRIRNLKMPIITPKSDASY